MGLFARSLLVLTLLFAMVFAVGAGVLYYQHVPIEIAVGFAVVVVVLQYLIGPMLIDWIYKITWYQPAQVSPEFEVFLREICAKRKIPMPRFGIINDGNPNAFTYGHTPSDARLVVTRGLMEMLSKNEYEAVVAHEVGHITHRDFIVMTIASLAPVILYILYRWGVHQRRGGLPAFLVGLGAGICYFISQYIVLFLSRVREFYADEHSAISMDDPNAIATALVKIGYGLARIPDPQQQAQQPQQTQPQPKPSFFSLQSSSSNKKQAPLFNKSQLMGPLGICNFSSVTPMALYSTTPNGQFSMDHMLRAMQWDLWNPWARWFELQSSHPLIAKRIRAASWIATRLNKPTAFPMTAPPKEVPWTTFIMDLMFLSLPYFGIILGVLFGYAIESRVLSAQNVNLPLTIIKLAMIFSGIGWLIRLAYSFGSNYKPSKIVDLVGELEVSHIRSIPVEVEGEIIGRGVPGIFWSKDLVLQDDTGFITLIYRQPFSILETLFGIFGANKLIGRKGKIKGWYRRGPAPYIELREGLFEYGAGILCLYQPFLWVAAALCTLVGFALMFIRI